MEIVTKDIENLLVFACRYCHSRQTGAALMTVKVLIHHWDEITPRTQATIIKEATSDATCNIEDWLMLIDYNTAKTT